MTTEGIDPFLRNLIVEGLRDIIKEQPVDQLRFLASYLQRKSEEGVTAPPKNVTESETQIEASKEIGKANNQEKVLEDPENENQVTPETGAVADSQEIEVTESQDKDVEDKDVVESKAEAEDEPEKEVKENEADDSPASPPFVVKESKPQRD